MTTIDRHPRHPCHRLDRRSACADDPGRGKADNPGKSGKGGHGRPDHAGEPGNGSGGGRPGKGGKG
ncbi:MAG TPA: hypothetical protein VFG72_00670 [Marmoricola sp.]|nr:hypothetical protein [Marmoricola sp.]